MTVWLIVLKFILLSVVNIQSQIFTTKDFEKHRMRFIKKKLPGLWGLCMSYLYNNIKIEKNKEIKQT